MIILRKLHQIDLKFQIIQKKSSKNQVKSEYFVGFKKVQVKSTKCIDRHSKTDKQVKNLL